MGSIRSTTGGLSSAAGNSTSSGKFVRVSFSWRTLNWPLLTHRRTPSPGVQTRLLESGSQTSLPSGPFPTSLKLKPDVIHAASGTLNVETGSLREDSGKNAEGPAGS